MRGPGLPDMMSAVPERFRSQGGEKMRMITGAIVVLAGAVLLSGGEMANATSVLSGKWLFPMGVLVVLAGAGVLVWGILGEKKAKKGR